MATDIPEKAMRGSFFLDAMWKSIRLVLLFAFSGNRVGRWVEWYIEGGEDQGGRWGPLVPFASLPPLLSLALATQPH